ncbi:hypothetical protein [Niveispirillum sp. KHB5.9]|uniref:hypothetical protein n=1 Tax=Niveispirillum sp. KHB5.9 TaxID=3400269 RepID=UPI003A8588F7
MSDGIARYLPWSCDQFVEWWSDGAHHAGRLTTWRGPRPDGLYVLTALERVGSRLVMVTLLSGEPARPETTIREVARFA